MGFKQSAKLNNGLTTDMSGNNNSRQHSSRVSELEYLADMIPQMRMMALGMEQKTLAYLLELAAIEAHLQLDLARFTQSVFEDDQG